MINTVGKFILKVLDLVFGFFVVLAVILIVSVIFYPHDNLLLHLAKWLVNKGDIL